MGKPVDVPRDALAEVAPKMDCPAVVAMLRDELGLSYVTDRTVKSATYARKLRRHLIGGRVRYSRADVLAWIESTRDAEYLDRRNEAAS